MSLSVAISCTFAVEKHAKPMTEVLMLSAKPVCVDHLFLNHDHG